MAMLDLDQAGFFASKVESVDFGEKRTNRA